MAPSGATFFRVCMKTAKAILDFYSKCEDRRSVGVGCSVLGNECDRKIWLDLRWFETEKFSGRMRRLLTTGHREEERVIADLKNLSGIIVHSVDPETGEQFRVSAHGGHISGYLDGIVKNIPEDPGAIEYALEIKTHSTKSFDGVKNKGVQKGKPQHYAQCLSVAHLKKLPGTLYIAICKETDDIYSELIMASPKKAEELIARAFDLVMLDSLPDGIEGNPEYPPCSFCKHSVFCYSNSPMSPVMPDLTCRSCIHATPQKEGGWRCDKLELALNKEQQEQACEHHLIRPDLLPYGEPVHVDETFILYPGMVVNKAGSGSVEVDR